MLIRNVSLAMPTFNDFFPNARVEKWRFAIGNNEGEFECVAKWTEHSGAQKLKLEDFAGLHQIAFFDALTVQPAQLDLNAVAMRSRRYEINPPLGLTLDQNRNQVSNLFPDLGQVSMAIPPYRGYTTSKTLSPVQLHRDPPDAWEWSVSIRADGAHGSGKLFTATLRLISGIGISHYQCSFFGVCGFYRRLHPAIPQGEPGGLRLVDPIRLLGLQSGGRRWVFRHRETGRVSDWQGIPDQQGQWTFSGAPEIALSRITVSAEEGIHLSALMFNRQTRNLNAPMLICANRLNLAESLELHFMVDEPASTNRVWSLKWSNDSQVPSWATVGRGPFAEVSVHYLTLETSDQTRILALNEDTGPVRAGTSKSGSAPVIWDLDSFPNPIDHHS